MGGSVILGAVEEIEKYYPRKRLSLYFDNYFTSVKLLEELSARGHGATGTLRVNRTEKCPFSDAKKFTKKPRESLEYYSTENSTIVLAKWLDNGSVIVGSNEHGVFPCAKAERYTATEKKCVQVPVPNLIKQYNCYMGGVDRLDQNISLYRIAIRGKKWYIPLLFYFIDVALNNAWLFARNGGYREDILSFRRCVAQDWLKTYRASAASPCSNRSSAIIASKTCSLESRYDDVGHTVLKSEPPLRRRCKICKSQTIFYCKKCNVFLHIKCSEEYHTKL